MCAIMGYTGTDIPMEKLLEGFGRTKSRGPDDSRVQEVPGGVLLFHRLAIMGPEPAGDAALYRGGRQRSGLQRGALWLP